MAIASGNFIKNMQISQCEDIVSIQEVKVTRNIPHLWQISKCKSSADQNISSVITTYQTNERWSCHTEKWQHSCLLYSFSLQQKKIKCSINITLYLTGTQPKTAAEHCIASWQQNDNSPPFNNDQLTAAQWAHVLAETILYAVSQWVACITSQYWGWQSTSHSKCKI